MALRLDHLLHRQLRQQHHLQRGHYDTEITDGPRQCQGDSGGMMVREKIGDPPLAVGLMAQRTGPSGPLCPYPGATTHSPHIGPKVGWVEDEIGRSCASFVSPTNPAITYTRCW